MRLMAFITFSWLHLMPTKKGLFRLDVENLSDASCLNSSHRDWKSLARDSVFTLISSLQLGTLDRVDASSRGRWVTRVRRSRNNFSRTQTSPFLTESEGQSYAAFARLGLPSTKPISALPSFGRICASVLSFAVFAMMVITAPLVPR